MAFDSRVRAVLVCAHERVMSASRTAVLAAACVASALVVAARVYGVLSEGVGSFVYEVQSSITKESAQQ